jgi:hypothetical protein
MWTVKLDPESDGPHFASISLLDNYIDTVPRMAWSDALCLKLLCTKSEKISSQEIVALSFLTPLDSQLRLVTPFLYFPKCGKYLRELDFCFAVSKV